MSKRPSVSSRSHGSISFSASTCERRRTTSARTAATPGAPAAPRALWRAEYRCEVLAILGQQRQRRRRLRPELGCDHLLNVSAHGKVLMLGERQRHFLRLALVLEPKVERHALIAEVLDVVPPVLRNVEQLARLKDRLQGEPRFGKRGKRVRSGA